MNITRNITASAVVLAAWLPTGVSAQEASTGKGDEIKQEIYAWRLTNPLGERVYVAVDTLPENYGQQSVPANAAPAFATTGNLGAPGETLIFFDRKPMSEFFFKDAVDVWLPTFDKERFFNTRMPMTLLSYNTSGGRENSQDRLQGTFSGNINKRAQVGALFDYLYSKGCYDYQATKALNWGFSGSYMGERYEMEAFYNHWNTLGKNNGGITNDLYITDPAQLQGGQTSIQPKAIPTRLTGAHSKIVGGELYVSNAYKVGFWKEEEVDDTTTVETYVPVTKFHWVLNYRNGKHIFRDEAGDSDFWEHSYFSRGASRDETSYHSLTNTLGIELLEEFNKFAHFGLTGFVTHELRSYKLMTDSVTGTELAEAEGLTPVPYTGIPAKTTENLLWVGGELSKHMGKAFTYDVTARIGLIGPVVGDFDVNGRINTRFRLLGDTVSITGYGTLRNEEAPFLMKRYVSNHFIWDNDFGKTRTVCFGGILNLPQTGTNLNVGAENVQNMLYFNEQCLPTQYGGSVQVFSATLNQNLHAGILHWDNRVTYQISSKQEVLPLPKLALYSNLYLRFKVAGVLDVQFGVDCDYYTKYRSISYQPATMAFYNQREIECGNYPFMNAYANMKLSKARFYVMMSHVNQGLTGNNYFSMPHYPLNPRRFQMGISIDFTN